MTPAVICVGELMWDFFAPAGMSLEEADRFRRFPGGAAANVALALSADGIPAAVMGVVSDDALGRGLRAALASRGVEVSGVLLHPGRTGLVFIAGDGARFSSYRPALGGHPPLVLGLHRTDAILHIAALDPERLADLAHLAARARREGMRVVLDLNARPRAFRERKPERERLVALASCADVVKASDDDLRVLGIASDELEPVRGLLGLGPEASLILTRGPSPTLASGPWGRLSLPPPPVLARRLVGAGDAFCAGLLAAMLEDLAGPEMVARAQRRAARHLVGSIG